MRSALHALLLAALLTTAGCAGGLGGGSTGTATTDATETATNADSLPPGLTTDGLTDPSALVRAHAAVLEDQSVTLREIEVRRYSNGSQRWRRNRTLRTAVNRTRFLSVTETNDRPIFGASDGRVAVFADGQHVYRKVETPNSSWTDVLRTATGDPENPRSVALDVARTDDLYVLLNAFALNDPDSVRKSAEDPQRYRIESSTLAHPDLLASHLDLATVRNATLTAVVTADGLVTEYRLTFVGTKRGTEVRGTKTLRYAAVGETGVEAPAWYEQVKNERVNE